MTTRERFDEKWTLDATTGCHEWTASTTHDGYGRFKWNGSTGRAHRYIWQEEYGPIPEGLVVRHATCSNPGCVNTDHLALGTQKDNIDDRDREGNAPRGTRNGQSKLQPDDVRQIRRLADEGMSHVDIARRFDVCSMHVGRIVNGERWKYVK